MRYRKLGRTGFEVSEIGAGLWGMSGWSGSNDEESLSSLQKAVDLGCNFFDTAWAYGEGKSDGLLGQILAGNKGKRIYAASKIPPKNQKWPASAKYAYRDVFPAAHVFDYADRIRKQLRTDSIDLLQFHVWDDAWAGDTEFRETIEKLKTKGTIRFFGLSLNRWEPENGIAALHTGLVDTVQVIYNVFDQAPEDKLFPMCRESDIGVIARVPLDEGSLGGRLTAESKFPANDWRSKYFGAENLKQTLPRIDRLKSALPDGLSLPQLALRFVLSESTVSTTIVGMRTTDHVLQNAAVSDAGPLPENLRQRLRAHRWDRKPEPWSD